MHQPAFSNSYKTKQELVYEELRDAIMRCELKPGQRLVIQAIADRFDISTIPVREALRMLNSEELVEHKPHVGAIVARISKESIVETFTVKEGLETVAARMAIQKLTPGNLEQLEVLLRQMEHVLKSGDYKDWGDLNSDFHESIASITGMPMLIEMSKRALQKWDRIRCYYFNEVFLPHLNRSHEEHCAIVQAISERDSERAEQLSREHNRSALNYYMDHLSKQEQSK